MITVTINLIDVTDQVLFKSLKIKNIINERADTCVFQTLTSGGVGYTPTLNDAVVIKHNITTIFSGIITDFDITTDGAKNNVYNINCKDFTHFLDKKLVTERYTNTTAGAIVIDLITRYTSDGFTTTAVNSSVAIASIAFDHLTVSQAIAKLARLVSHSWYVDYVKDVHFFAKEGEVAPFTVTETNGNAIDNSIEIKQDISQIKNSVLVQGGDEITITTNHTIVSTGENETYVSVYKYGEKPTVTVNNIFQSVGIEGLDDSSLFDVMWRLDTFRFKAVPAVGLNIKITGKPLVPIIVSIKDNVSITKYGEFEAFVKDDAISTKSQALDRANAEIEAYANEINEGNFQTYKDGLVAGQTITLNTLGVNEKFIIQKVTIKPIDQNDFIYTIILATLRTVGIVDVLRRLLIQEEITSDENKRLISTLVESDSFNVADSYGTKQTLNPPYVYAPDGGNTANYNQASWI